MNLKKTCGILLLAATLFSPAAGADNTKQSVFRLDGLARVDWQQTAYDGHTSDASSGFRGKYLMLRADGQIAPGFTYSWRQRLNSTLATPAFFDATDWVYLNYAVKGWNFQAGKEIVAIGGYEYDRHPADLYATSVFWNNVYCYELGISTAYNIGSNDMLTLQAVQSPYRTLCGDNNTYGYNLMWNGRHGCYEAIWSANLMEYAKGRYINYLVLGNRLTLGSVTAEIDYMNRYARGQAFLFSDMTFIGDLAWNISDRWKIHAKYTYDRNKSHTGKDLFVREGTNLNMAGGGVEFYPLLKDRTSLRLHACAYYAWGRNGNAADLMQSRTLFTDLGLTWTMNFLNIRKKQ